MDRSDLWGQISIPMATTATLTPTVSVISATAQNAPAAYGHTPGLLEVLHVRKTKLQGDTITLEGFPGSRSSKVRHAKVTFVPSGSTIPAPMLDEASGRIEMYYAEAERDEVLHVLRSGRERLCYFWKDGHGTRVRAWMMATQ